MRKISTLAFASLCLALQAQPDTVITVNLENDAVRRYMSEVTYTSPDDLSRVGEFNFPPPDRRDLPNGAFVPVPPTHLDTLALVYSESEDFSGRTDTIGIGKNIREVAVYNLVPRRAYYYKIEGDDAVLTRGEIHTEGLVRMIYVPTTNNVRDLGGWPTIDGKRVRYGKLFRGADVNGTHIADSADLAVFTNVLGVGGEVDLRGAYNPGNRVSAFGFTASALGNLDEPTYYFTWDSGQLPEHLTEAAWQYRWRREFEFIVNNLKRGRNVFFHCVWGSDRTGYLSVMLEGLLGLDYDSLVKDYELSAFYSYRDKTTIDPVITFIMDLEGETLKDKFETYFVKHLNVTNTDIDYFRAFMLVDDDDENNPVTAIGNIPQTRREVKLYDMSGRRVASTTGRGLVIEIGTDGKVRKRLKIED